MVSRRKPYKVRVRVLLSIIIGGGTELLAALKRVLSSFLIVVKKEDAVIEVRSRTLEI